MTEAYACSIDSLVTSFWDRKTRRILIAEAETEPLVGMQLMKGYELMMKIRPNGRVTLKRLAAR
jgi:hypothetical protein